MPPLLITATLASLPAPHHPPPLLTLAPPSPPRCLQTGEETFFKIKRSTKMEKVFQTYATRKGVDYSSLRFLLDGERIPTDATPKSCECFVEAACAVCYCWC
jgi:small ubiquitin-related modifier